jgi:hypothetical protein
MMASFFRSIHCSSTCASFLELSTTNSYILSLPKQMLKGRMCVLFQSNDMNTMSSLFRSTVYSISSAPLLELQQANKYPFSSEVNARRTHVSSVLKRDIDRNDVFSLPKHCLSDLMCLLSRMQPKNISWPFPSELLQAQVNVRSFPKVWEYEAMCPLSGIKYYKARWPFPSEFPKSKRMCFLSQTTEHRTHEFCSVESPRYGVHDFSSKSNKYQHMCSSFSKGSALVPCGVLA